MALPEHEEHLRDQRSLHRQKCDRHEDAGVQGRGDPGDATLQTRGTLHPGRRFLEGERLRAESHPLPMLGHPGGGQLPGPPERRRHCPRHAGHPVGPRRWHRQHFGATCQKVPSQGDWNRREEWKGRSDFISMILITRRSELNSK